MAEYGLMWKAYYMLPDDDMTVVTEGASRIAALTGIGFAEALYVLWKIGMYLAESETAIFKAET